jgi:hypothetical protein
MLDRCYTLINERGSAMKFFDIQVTERCRLIAGSYINAGDLAVDCTMGNGRDTLFLADAVGPEGKVIAFDIQKKALDNTRKLLGDRPWVELHQASNADMWKYVNEVPKIIMYNLGYLPGGDHSITTQAEETMSSLRGAVTIIGNGGLITIITYPGHDEGMREDLLIRNLIGTLPDSDFETLTIEESNRSKDAPVLHLIYRRPGGKVQVDEPFWVRK